MLKIDFGAGYNPKFGYKTLDFNYGSDYYSLDEIENESVDEFNLRNVIHHINNLDNLAKQLFNKLKDNGKIVIIDCNEEHFKNNIILDKIWYRYIFNTNLFISEKYINPIPIFLNNKFKVIKYKKKKEKFILTLKK